jgi:PIN domain nuclease of toxin-antitoxin system
VARNRLRGLLETRAFRWRLAGSAQLSAAARQVIGDDAETVDVNAAPAGRHHGPDRERFDRLPVAQASGEEPALVSNADPFDTEDVRRPW